MDPVVFRLFQVIAAEVFGFALAGLGVWLFVRGAAGKMSLFVEGAGVKARITNAAPGGVVFLAGCAVAIIALVVPDVQRTTAQAAGENSQEILADWLDRSRLEKKEDDYTKVQDVIWALVPSAGLASLH